MVWMVVLMEEVVEVAVPGLGLAEMVPAGGVVGTMAAGIPKPEICPRKW